MGVAIAVDFPGGINQWIHGTLKETIRPTGVMILVFLPGFPVNVLTFFWDGNPPKDGSSTLKTYITNAKQWINMGKSFKVTIT